MNKATQDDLEVALLAHDAGVIDRWVQDFLRGDGGNEKLADILLGYSENKIGPIDYPLDKVINIIGPTDQYKFYEDESELNTRVDKMVTSIAAGWRPAPLILTDIWDEQLEIADGGHRHRALLKVGYIDYPTVIYFRNKESKDKFITEIERSNYIK